MTWVRLADDFPDHPKLIAAGPLAGWLWVCGLAYANKHLTDGFVPSGAVRRLVDADDPPRLAARLVEVGLWERASDGYRIHDFTEYQPSAESVRAERKAAAERMAAWRERQKSGRDNDRSNGVTSDVTSGSPDPAVNPVLNPVPAGTPTPLPPSPQAGPGARPQPGDDDDRKSRRRRGRTAQNRSPSPPEVSQVPQDLVPATPADTELWDTARDRLTDGWLPVNAEKARAVEVLGRDAVHGGLWLRVPAEARAVASWHQLVGALGEAGDAHASDVTMIVEG